MPGRLRSPAALPHPSGARPTGRSGAAAALAVFLLALLFHARLLDAGWLAVSDAALRAPTSWSEAWRAHGLAGLTLFLERGESALPARLVAALLHAGSSALVVGLAARLGLARPGAFLCGALFALHPLRMEALAWLAERGTLLGTFFLLLGSRLSLPRPRAPARRILAAGVLLLALLAEPALALAVPWLVLAQRSVARAQGAEPPRPAPELWLLALSGALLFVLHEGWPEAQRILWLAFGLARIAWLWVLPLELSVSQAPIDPDAPAWLAGLGWVFALAFAASLSRLLARAPLGAPAGALFVLAGAGALLAGEGALFSESAGYASALGLELAAVGLASGLCARLPAGLARRLPAPLALLWLALLGLRSWQRLPDWRSEPALQHSALASRPEDVRALDALARWHLLSGRLSQAQRTLEHALELAPHDIPVRLHLGEIALRRALIPGAEGELHNALAILEACADDGPGRAGVDLCLAEVHLRARDPRAAQVFAERAVAGAPREPLAELRRAMVALQLGAFDTAVHSFRRTLALDPRSAVAWSGLGLVRLQQGAPEEARAALERALELEPDHVESRHALGRIHALTGALALAEEEQRRAVEVNPDYTEALFALGSLLADTRPEEALRYLERVLALVPATHVRAALASARLRMARGEIELPRQRLEAVLEANPTQAEARALLDQLDQLDQREGRTRR